MGQDAMQSRMLKDLSVRLFAGSAAQLALHALAMEPASAGELDEIRKLIERRSATDGTATTGFATTGSGISGKDRR